MEIPSGRRLRRLPRQPLVWEPALGTAPLLVPATALLRQPLVGELALGTALVWLPGTALGTPSAVVE